MFIHRRLLITATLIILIILLALGINYTQAAIITLLLVMPPSCILVIIRDKRRLSLLNVKCDPQAFLENIKHQQKRIGKNKSFLELLKINESAALIEMGESSRALDLLETIDPTILPPSQATLNAYYVNYLGCLYILGDYSLAEEIFEQDFSSLSFVGSQQKNTKKLFLADRLYFLEKYSESQASYTALLDMKFPLRIRLHISYMMAQISEVKGDILAALEKYKEVATLGNKLYIAEISREKILTLKKLDV